MITGSVVALVTPMTKDGSIDLKALEQLIDWHLEQQTSAVVIIGTTGESPTLTAAEKKRLTQHTVAQVAHRIPVIAGTGTNATLSTIEATQAAKDAGADACLIVTPYYNRPTQAGLFYHFKKTAEAVAIPQILYNVPHRTGCDLEPETVVDLSTIKNIIGLKEATAKIERVTLLRQNCPQDFALYSGEDTVAMEFMLQGGNGVISVTANIAPGLMHQMATAAIYSNRLEATRLNNKLHVLHLAMGLEPNPTAVKYALYMMGRIDSGIRLPLLPLSQHHRCKLKAALNTAGIETFNSRL